MKKHLFVFVLLSSLILAACQPAAATATVSPTTGGGDKSAYPAPGATTASNTAGSGGQSYPAPSASAGKASAGETSAGSSYPAPAGDNGSAFPVRSADDSMVKGNFMIESASLQPVANQPGQADVIAQGSLPTSCNKPRVVVPAPDADKKILIQAYSLAEKDKICAQAIEPFNGKLAALSGLPSGKYTVMVNDINAGELTVP